MPRPVRLAFACIVAWRAMASAVAAEEARVTPPKARAISAHMRAVLAAKLPAYDPAKAVAPPPAESSTGSNESAASDPAIVQMPRMVINEDKLPTPEIVMTDKARAELAMNQYLGSRDGLDRGFLNRFTVAEFWRKIPLLGTLMPSPFGITTNEERAMRLYRRDQQLRLKQGLLDLGTITGKTGDSDLGKKIERETRRIFGPQ